MTINEKEIKEGTILSVPYYHYYGTGVDFYKVKKICAKTAKLAYLENRYLCHSIGGDSSTYCPGKELEFSQKDCVLRFVNGVAKVGRDRAEVWNGIPVTTYNYS